MWPFDRHPSRDCVRLSRVALERWANTAGRLRLAASHPLDPGALTRTSLVLSLRAIFPAPTHAVADLVVDSAWLPLMLVDTGGVLWSRPQVEALVRHRLGLLYDAYPVAATAWNVRADHRAGDRFALGAGLPASAHEALAGAAGEVGMRWASLTPAFHWGWRRLQPQRGWPRRTGWFVWLEHDRALVGRIEHSRLTGFNAGATLCEDAEDVERLIQAEAFRLGRASKHEPVAVGSWNVAPAKPDRLRQPHIHWHALAGGAAPAHRAAALAQHPLESAA